MNKKIIVLILTISVIIPIGFIIFENEKKLDRTLTYEPVVFYSYLTKTEHIEPTNTDRFSEIPNRLIIEPGNYIFEGKIYEANSEGLYKFNLPQEYNVQRIVYKNNIDALISSVAWIYSHGNSDNGLSSEQINKKAMSGKIFGTCGSISNWMKDILEKHNIPIRIVATLTLDKWNSYDNGHTMIEIYKEKEGWILYDLDNNVYFEKNGKKLSLVEFVNVIDKNENYEMIKIADDISLDISNFGSKGYDYALLFDHVYGNEKNLRDWYERVIQVPLIKEADKFYFFDESNKEKILEYSGRYSYMTQDTFFEKFY